MNDNKETENNPLSDEQKEAIRNPIITAGDQERFSLLEMESLSCDLPISAQDQEAIALMDALLEQLDEEAAGLAAVQIGYPRRIFLLRNGRDEDGRTFNKVYINPVVVARSKETKKLPEACLSLPHMVVQCRRPKSITLEYIDLAGEFQVETFNGFFAQCVAHEMDHLRGRLIIHDLEEQIAKQPRRTSFGMVLTPKKKKDIARRRAKAKRLKRAKKHAKSIGR